MSDNIVVSELIATITDNIEHVMMDKGINKTELAQMLGVSKSHVSRLLSGTRNMRLSTVEKIANVLGVTISVEFDGKKWPGKSEPIESLAGRVGGI